MFWWGCVRSCTREAVTQEVWRGSYIANTELWVTGDIILFASHALYADVYQQIPILHENILLFDVVNTFFAFSSFVL